MTRKNTQPIAHVLTKMNLTVFVKSGQKTVARDHLQFAEIMAAVQAGQEDKLNSLLNPQLLHKHESGLWEVNGHGEVHIDGRMLPKALSDRLTEFHANGWSLTPLIKLWKNILANPDATAQTDLYPYLEYNGHAITPDGCFLAYRGVKKEVVDGEETGRLVDSYTGTMDNSLGTIVKMKRENCVSDRNITCAPGLHAANMDYVKGGYHGKIIVNVKVNPKDVVSIPKDYENHKMRCCEFKVVSINEELTELTGLQRIDNEVEEYDDEEFDDLQAELGSIVVQAGLSKEDLTSESWKLQKRDATGRFIPGKKRKN